MVVSNYDIAYGTYIPSYYFYSLFHDTCKDWSGILLTDYMKDGKDDKDEKIDEKVQDDVAFWCSDIQSVSSHDNKFIKLYRKHKNNPFVSNHNIIVRTIPHDMSYDLNDTDTDLVFIGIRIGQVEKEYKEMIDVKVNDDVIQKFKDVDKLIPNKTYPAPSLFYIADDCECCS